MTAFQNLPLNLNTTGFAPITNVGVGQTNQPPTGFIPPTNNNNLLPDINGNGGPNSGPGGSPFNRGTGLIPGLQAFSSLVDAYTGLKQLNLSQDAFDFNKDLTRTNLENQARVTNAAIGDRARAAAVQRGTEGAALDQIVAQQTASRRIRGTL